MSDQLINTETAPLLNTSLNLGMKRKLTAFSDDRKKSSESKKEKRVGKDRVILSEQGKEDFIASLMAKASIPFQGKAKRRAKRQLAIFQDVGEDDRKSKNEEKVEKIKTVLSEQAKENFVTALRIKALTSLGNSLKQRVKTESAKDLAIWPNVKEVDEPSAEQCRIDTMNDFQWKEHSLLIQINRLRFLENIDENISNLVISARKRSRLQPSDEPCFPMPDSVFSLAINYLPIWMSLVQELRFISFKIPTETVNRTSDAPLYFPPSEIGLLASTMVTFSPDSVGMASRQFINNIRIRKETKIKYRYANKVTSARQNLLLYKKKKSSLWESVTKTRPPKLTLSRKEVLKMQNSQKSTFSLQNVSFYQLRPSYPAPPLIFDQEKIRRTIKSKKVSCPGPNGVRYKDFLYADESCYFLQYLFNSILFFNYIPPSFMTSNLTLIPKSKSPKLVIENFRPIGLQNTDYKIFSSIIADYLVDFLNMNDVISPTQFGFIQNKKKKENGILEAISLHQSIMSHAISHKKDLILIYLDLKSAFDSVPHLALFQTLRHLKINERVISIIQSVYENHVMIYQPQRH